MPLLTIHLVQGRSEPELSCLLDTIHSVVLEAFGVPERDRYQIVHEHAPTHFVVQDTGLDIPRTTGRVLIEVTSRPRRREDKQRFYELMSLRLHAECSVRPEDLVVTITDNADEDWSFGHGRAQFLTGEL